ncbi:MAG TPA: NAD-dependent epimerase/dehydratase family protein [Candidatus Limnocylindrales bacterium]|nr:NAD-dependent epimerase/dehydratase family protein [Candidatus Limnocylindrales bacterium]
MNDQDGRVVLFGGTGFVGSRVAAELAQDPGRRIVVVPRSTADLSDRSSLERTIRPGDVVVNAAGYAAATDRSADGLQRFRTVNVEGVRILAEASIARGARQLVHVSSVAAMGRLSGGPHDETATGPLMSPYAWSKRAAEAALAELRDELAVTVIRPTSVFGEGRGLAATLCRFVTLPVVVLPGGGASLIPFTYVQNVAQAVALAIGRETCYGRTFIVGDEHSYELREVIAALAAALGVRPRTVAAPSAVLVAGANLLERIARRRGVPPLLDASRVLTLTTSVSYSIGAFVAASGYRPRVGLADATERIARWYAGERVR